MHYSKKAIKRAAASVGLLVMFGGGAAQATMVVANADGNTSSSLSSSATSSKENSDATSSSTSSVKNDDQKVEALKLAFAAPSAVKEWKLQGEASPETAKSGDDVASDQTSSSENAASESSEQSGESSTTSGDASSTDVAKQIDDMTTTVTKTEDTSVDSASSSAVADSQSSSEASSTSDKSSVDAQPSSSKEDATSEDKYEAKVNDVKRGDKFGYVAQLNVKASDKQVTVAAVDNELADGLTFKGMQIVDASDNNKDVTNDLVGKEVSPQKDVVLSQETLKKFDGHTLEIRTAAVVEDNTDLSKYEQKDNKAIVPQSMKLVVNDKESESNVVKVAVDAAPTKNVPAAPADKATPDKQEQAPEKKLSPTGAALEQSAPAIAVGSAMFIGAMGFLTNKKFGWLGKLVHSVVKK